MRSFILVLGIIVMIVGCKMEPCITKSYFMSSYETFMKSVKKEQKSYSTDDWESKDTKVREFVNDCYVTHKEDLSAEEKAKFWSKYLEYMLLRHKASVLAAINKENKISPIDIGEEMALYIDDLDIEKLIKDSYSGEIESAVDNIVNQVEHWGNNVKRWLKEK